MVLILQSFDIFVISFVEYLKLPTKDKKEIPQKADSKVHDKANFSKWQVDWPWLLEDSVVSFTILNLFYLGLVGGI